MSARTMGDGDSRDSLPYREVLVVLIGSADCNFSKDETTRRSFKRIVESERTKAASDQLVRTLGVAVELDAERGLRALNDVGKFDEVLAGGGWQNLGALQFVVREMASPLVVPQVLILSRQVTKGTHHTTGPDSLHVRLQGVFAIARWATRL